MTPHSPITCSDKSRGAKDGTSRCPSDGLSGRTVVVNPDGALCRKPSYVRCDSDLPFEMPPLDDVAAASREIAVVRSPSSLRRRLSAEEVNKTLTLNLGLGIDPMQPKLRALCRWVSNFFALFEEWFFALWERLPLRFRQKLTFISWRLYLPLHRILLGRRTAIHHDASHEYHALTTIMWWGRLFPVTVRRMRFSLSQLGVCHPPEAYPPCLKQHGRGGGRLEETSTSAQSSCGSMSGDDAQTAQAVDPSVVTIFSAVRYDMGRSYWLAKDTSRRCDDEGYADDDDGSSVVTGYYVQHGRESSEKVVFWLYGGAYLAGDSRGNLGIAEKVGQRCHGADVFLPDYRLLPEHEFYDAHFDVVLAYEYLISVRGVKPENVILLGVSSGGGLCTRLLQTIAERREEVLKNENDAWEGKSKTLIENPSGAVLMCPFVDYTEPQGSFKEYIAHDLIVNQSVFEEGVPYLASLGSAANRQEQSPAHRSFRGLPPLCVVVSEHECCFDQTILLVNRARDDGVSVTIGVWRYMCHVFPMLSMFVPEGRQAIEFMVEWMKENLS